MTQSSTLAFHRWYDRLRHQTDALERFVDLEGLLGYLRHAPGDPEGKNRLLRALISTAQSDGSSGDNALTVLLLGLWPGLDAARQRMIRRRFGTPEEIASEVLVRATGAIRGLRLDRVNRIAATLQRNIERDIFRAWERRQPDEAALDIDDQMAVPAHGDASDACLLLRHDLFRILGEDAWLVRAVAIHGFTQTEVAALLGLSADAARKRYQRALGRLRPAFAPETVSALQAPTMR